MKMSRKTKTLFCAILSVLCFLCIGVACDKNNKDKHKFTGLTVAQTAQAEAGTNYFFEKPIVMYGDQKVDVIVSVLCNDKVIAHNGKNLYLENVGIYTITYSAVLKDVSATARTTLTVVDTQGPIVVSKFPKKIRGGYSFDLDEFFFLTDVSKDKEITGYEVYDTAFETQLSETQFNRQTNLLTVTDETVKEITVKVTAKDGNGTLSQASFNFGVYPMTEYGKYDFAAYEVNQTDLSGIDVEFGKVSSSSVSIVEDGGEKVLKIAATTVETNQTIKIAFQNQLIGEFGKFDEIAMSIKATCSDNGGNAGLTDEYYYPNDVSNFFKSSNGQWKTYIFTKEEIFNNLQKEDKFTMIVKAWAAQDVEIYLKDIQGKYANLNASESAISLNQRLGLETTELSATFVPKTGPSQVVSNVEQCIVNTSGKLQVVIDKQGYKQTRLAVNVIKLGVFGNFTFADYSLGEIDGITATIGTMEIVQRGDDKVWTLTVENATANTYNYVYFPTSLIGDFSEFDYVEFEMSMTNTCNGIIGLGTEFGISDNCGIVGGNTFTHLKDNEHICRYERDVSIPTIKTEKGIKLSIKNWQAGDYTLTIKSIKGGYHDIQTDGETPMDITAMFSKNVTKAIFITENGVETEVVDLNNFVATESGTLKLVCKPTGYDETILSVGVTKINN